MPRQKHLQTAWKLPILQNLLWTFWNKDISNSRLKNNRKDKRNILILNRVCLNQAARLCEIGRDYDWAGNISKTKKKSRIIKGEAILRNIVHPLISMWFSAVVKIYNHFVQLWLSFLTSEKGPLWPFCHIDLFPSFSGAFVGTWWVTPAAHLGNDRVLIAEEEEGLSCAVDNHISTSKCQNMNK